MNGAAQVAVSAVATFGFALIFRVKPRDLPLAAAGGAMAWGVRLLAGAWSGSDPMAYFIAAIAVGLYAELVATMMRTPATVIIVASIIPLVPGGGMFYTMSQATAGDAIAAATTGFATLMLAGAIAAGLAVAAAIARLAPRGLRQRARLRRPATPRDRNAV
ncbi:MAG TPA: threonine/serine exporter family protein [Spirochaetales bacterium]|nr:threonine/serine exporter family protein [Spirochaetales bacterium]